MTVSINDSKLYQYGINLDDIGMAQGVTVEMQSELKMALRVAIANCGLAIEVPPYPILNDTVFENCLACLEGWLYRLGITRFSLTKELGITDEGVGGLALVDIQLVNFRTALLVIRAEVM